MGSNLRTTYAGGQLKATHKLAVFLLIALCVSANPIATFGTTTSGQKLRLASFEQQERHFERTLARASQFLDVPHIHASPCEEIQDPVALATPDPMFAPTGAGKKVRVSFIIGIDGHVHSPLILESGGLAGDRRVLDTVRRWRYRPGTCNGVPTETEGKIEFSIR